MPSVTKSGDTVVLMDDRSAEGMRLVSEAKALISDSNNRYAEAAVLFSDALEILASVPDDSQTDGSEFRELLAPVYFEYGKCLLELSRMNNEFLGPDVPDVEADDSFPNGLVHLDEEGVEDIENVSEDLGEHCEESDGCDVSGQDFLSDSIDQRSREAMECALDICDDLQLSWEALDMARIIYQRKLDAVPEDAETGILLADVFVALGDVCMESETFSEALRNFHEALRLKRVWDAHGSLGREMAEIYFKTSLALECLDRWSDALSDLEKAKDILSNRLEMLTGLVSEDGAEDMVRREVEDLQLLIPDLDEKISSAREHQAGDQEEEVSARGEETEGGCVHHDVSGLVKKKRVSLGSGGGGEDLLQHEKKSRCEEDAC